MNYYSFFMIHVSSINLIAIKSTAKVTRRKKVSGLAIYVMTVNNTGMLVSHCTCLFPLVHERHSPGLRQVESHHAGEIPQRVGS